jgi:hypothetical protein
MKRLELRWWRLVKYLAYLCVAVLLGAGLLGAVLARAAGDGAATPSWAAPSVMALKRVSPVISAQHEPNFLSNLDCTLADYRLVAGGALRTGCFTPTAYGLLDSDSDTVIFNGTDEGLPLLPYSPHQVLAPWPGASDMVVLDAANTGGSYISLYKNPLSALQDQRDPLLRLTAKQLTAPPDLPLRGPDGKQLVVNPQTIAFSDGGSWLVAETLGGSFIRINLATLDMTAFAPAFGSQGSPALLKSQVAASGDGRYVAIANDAASSLKVYDLAACGGEVAGLQPRDCASHDYLPFVRQQVAGFQSVRHLRFVNDGLLSFEAQASNPDSGGIYELAPRDSIKSLIDYLGLGDSYTSGEGAFDYRSGTDTDDNMCHLSANSYPLLLTRDLFSSVGGHSVACSGAVISDVGSTSLGYRGQVRGVATLEQLQKTQPLLLDSIMANYLPGYVAQQRFAGQYQPAVITVSVGGDDIGFGDIVQGCVVPHVSLHLSDSNCYSTYEDRLELTRLIDRTVPRWTALYKQLLAEAPGTRVYAVGYPEVVADTGNCALNAHLGKSELEFSEELIDYLNNSVRQAAAKAGVTYVDIGQALAGHRLCETASYNVAVNGLTAGKDGKVLGVRVFGKESYHPNALGQALIEQAILKQTHNLAAPAVATNPDGSGQDILKAPKTGRVIHNRVPDNGLTTGVAKPGKAAALKASGARDGLKPKTVYSVRLDGPNGPIIGTVASDDNGDIAAGVTLPDNTTPGGHTIDVTGDNQDGEPVDVTQPVYVPASDNDADGDGIPDTSDTCPGAINSGQDSDQDGIDDTCDGFIGPPPVPGGSGGANGQDTAGAGPTGSPVTGSGAGNTGMTLGAESPTVVAGFTVGGGMAAVPAAVQAADNLVNTARVLGAATANPVTVAAKNFRPPAKTGQTGFRGPFAVLPVINWLPWAVLAVIVWLLLLLGLGARRLVNRTKIYQNQRLSTTIDK